MAFSIGGLLGSIATSVLPRFVENIVFGRPPAPSQAGPVPVAVAAPKPSVVTPPSGRRISQRELDQAARRQGQRISQRELDQIARRNRLSGGAGSRALVGAAGRDVLMAGVPAIRGAQSFIAGLLGTASASIGKRVTSRNVVALVKSIGLTGAAIALSLTIEEVAQIFATAPRRRRRGISARDIATTKRVISTTARIAHDLAHLSPRRAPVRRHHHHRK